MTVASTIVFNNPATIAGLPGIKDYADPVILPFTKWLLDFTDGRCQPTKNVIVPGLLANGTAYKDLVSGISAVVANGTNGADMTANADGSITMPGTLPAATASQIQVGTAGQFDMSGTNSGKGYQYVYIQWIKIPATGYTTNNQLLGFLGLSVNTSNAQVWLSTNNGLSPQAVIGNGSGSATVTSSVQLTPGSVAQIAISVQPFGTSPNITIYINGQPAGSLLYGVPALVACPAAKMALWSSAKCQVYRASFHDMDDSIAAMTSQGYDPSNIPTAAQLILRDYQFCTGALANTAGKPLFT